MSDNRPQKVTLSQTQIIRSLADALTWLEREVEWNAPAEELRHLTGRIGELYTAMITRGQMALNVNQRGYDVVSGDNQRISVKTVTSSSHARFNVKTFSEVDRCIILRIDTSDEITIEEIADFPASDVLEECVLREGHYVYSTRLRKEALPLEHLDRIASISFEDCVISQYENGTIQILKAGEAVATTKPVLRHIASKIGVSLLNGNDNKKNTRQLGADVIATLRALQQED